MPIPTNRSRPNLPYVPTQTLPNSNRYQALNKFPPKAEQLDADLNALVDMVNEVAQAVNETAAGVFPGATDMLNAHKLPTTDGQGNVSWTYVNSNNMSVGCVQERHLQSQAVTTDKIQQRAVKGHQIGIGEVLSENIAEDAIIGVKVKAGTLPLQKLSPSSSVSVMAGSSDGNSWIECPLNPWEIATNVPVHPRPYGQALNTIWENTPGTFNGSKLAYQSIPYDRVRVGPGWGMVPTGSIISYAGPTMGFQGFLSCDGRAVSKREFPELFGIIGNLYGPDSEDQFLLPDLAGRVIVGITGGSTKNRVTGATANTLTFGGYGGAETHTLDINQMPPHAHTHNFPSLSLAQYAQNLSTNVYSGTTTNTTSSAGGGQPHNNMPPFLLLNYIIKT